jgi:hypothetical protein
MLLGQEMYMPWHFTIEQLPKMKCRKTICTGFKARQASSVHARYTRSMSDPGILFTIEPERRPI